MTTTQIILEIIIMTIVYWVGVGLGYVAGVIKGREDGNKNDRK